MSEFIANLDPDTWSVLTIPEGTRLISDNAFFSPWWFLGLMLIAVFVIGMVAGIGSVIGWKEFAQKIRMLLLTHALD